MREVEDVARRGACDRSAGVTEYAHFDRTSEIQHAVGNKTQMQHSAEARSVATMNATMNTEQRRKERGFTLIEILVVVVIVGVLATLVAQNLGGTQEQANLAATQHEIETIKSAALRYKMANQQWPETIEELVGNEESTIRYLDEVPVDKWTGAPYTIERQGGGILVVCAGANGNVGDDDDLTSDNIKKMKLAEYLEIIKQGN